MALNREIIQPERNGRIDHVHAGAFNGGDRFTTRQVAIMTEDMGPFVGFHLDSIFGNNLSSQKKDTILSIARNSLPQYQEVLRAAFPGRDWTITEQNIDSVYHHHIEQALNENPQAVIVINDRYVASGIEEKYPNNVFRFSSTRVLQGTNTGNEITHTVPRPGDPSFETQMDEIENKLKETGRSLKDATVIFADDVNVKASTETTFGILFSQKGSVVDPQKSIYIYKVFTGNADASGDRPKSAGRSISRNASTEQREYTPLGGPLKLQGKHVALQQPAQAPWGNGEILRTDGMIHQPHLSEHQLKLFLELFGEIEKNLIGEKRIDGTEFKYFSFADFRWSIPSSSKFGPSEMIREYTRLNGKPPSNLHDLSLLDYIRLAHRENKQLKNPNISLVVADIDGTQLKLQYEDPTRKSFGDSFLGAQIRKRVINLIGEFAGDVLLAEQIIKGHDIEQSVTLLYSLPGFSDFLESEYGELILEKLKDRFTKFYGDKPGKQEFEHFLQQYNLPVSYHVLRELTWGQVDRDNAYKGISPTAKIVNDRVIKNKAHLVFVSAAPRIHALRLLDETGQRELITSGKAHLVTVEDLYYFDRGILEEQSKGVVYAALSSLSIEKAQSLFPEMNTSTKVFERIRESSKGFTTHPKNMLAVGDQFFSDVRPMVTIGGKGYLVNGPDDLVSLFDYASIGSIDNN